MAGTYRRTLLLSLVALSVGPVLLVAIVMIVVLELPAATTYGALMVVLLVGLGTALAAIPLALTLGRELAAPVEALREGLALMVGANPRNRLALPDETDLAEIVRNANALADLVSHADDDAAARLAATTHDLELERSILASILFAMVDGVLVCNRDRQIVLSNGAARRMLSSPSRPLRRGGDLFEHLSEPLLRPLLDGLDAEQESRFGEQRVERGMLTLPSGEIAQVQVMLAGEAEHYVLVIRDVTHQVALDRSRDRFIAETVQRLRGPVASVLSAAEILRDYDDLPASQRVAFLGVVTRDAERIADELDAMHITAGGLAATGSGETVNLREVARRAVAEAAGQLAARELSCTTEGDDLAVRGDRLGLLQAVRRLLDTAASGSPRGSALVLRWRPVGESLVEISLTVPAWPGLGDQLFDTPVDGEGGPTVRALLQEHRGEVWIRRRGPDADLVLSLPAVSGEPDAPADPAADTVAQQVLSLVGHGGFFDLRPPAVNALPHRQARLRDLAFAVFDLETTGLGPGYGDQIVSIGAVRVKGGEVIPEDYFFTLTDPARPIPAASTRFHGITDEMVVGQPSVPEAVERFARFVEGSVPVAHVAAFDLAFLNPRLAALGQPPLGGGAVLDTLLLACSLFPSWSGFNLEEMAARLGLDVVGRHTSLGDAVTTARILVRLIGTMEQRGIETLEQALDLQSGDVVRKAVSALGLGRDWG